MGSNLGLLNENSKICNLANIVANKYNPSVNWGNIDKAAELTNLKADKRTEVNKLKPK